MNYNKLTKEIVEQAIEERIAEEKRIIAKRVKELPHRMTMYTGMALISLNDVIEIIEGE